MRTLLAIIACPRDAELVRRHWSYFRLCSWDILGVGTLGGECVWPEAIQHLDIGKTGVRQTPAGSVIWPLVELELDVIKHFLDQQEYDALCISEPDNLFVRKPVEHPRNGMYLAPILPNYCRAGIFKTPIYFSTPRIMDRKCAEVFYAHAKQMFDRGETEHHVSDRFPALVCQQGRIPWMNYPAWSPLPFSATGSDWIRDARCAIALGACCLHSVKFEGQLDAIKDLIKI